jgi:hypothetical protein
MPIRDRYSRGYPVMSEWGETGHGGRLPVLAGLVDVVEELW